MNPRELWGSGLISGSLTVESLYRYRKEREFQKSRSCHVTSCQPTDSGACKRRQRRDLEMAQMMPGQIHNPMNSRSPMREATLHICPVGLAEFGTLQSLQL